MAYIVTRNIIDTKDNNRFYETGDIFPRKGFEVSKDRLAELIGKGVLSAKGEETPAPAPTEEVAPVEETEKPVEKLKVAELKELLEKAGVEYEADAKKADLVALAQTIEGE
nr:MAG: Thymopoietin protein [Bacteriophage sp.]